MISRISLALGANGILVEYYTFPPVFHSRFNSLSLCFNSIFVKVDFSTMQPLFNSDIHSFIFSIMTAHEYIEQAIKIIITLLTIISALINSFKIEKSVLLASPTACEVISASIYSISH